MWWGDVLFAGLRQPKEGSLKSNLHQWWVYTMLDSGQIPHELVDITKILYEKLDNKGFFSFDVWYSRLEEKRYLIEINAWPSIWFPSETKGLSIVYKKIIASLLIA